MVPLKFLVGHFLLGKLCVCCAEPRAYCSCSVACVSAASIIAKVHRDRLMHALHEKHPQYGWAANKGYGSKAHRAAITKHGWVTGLHRESFDPVRSMINE